MPGGDESSPSALEMINQAQTITQIPLPGKFHRVASGLNNKPQTEQVSTLLYAMGDSADDILQTLQLDEGTVSYEAIKKSLNDHFAEWRNVIVERARCNKRSQIAGESVDTFIQDLYRLADNCDYGVLKDSLI